MDSVVKAEGLGKNFGSITAVDSVSFELAKGEIFGFLGPNGAGKTTTIRMLAGMIAPSSGHAEVKGINVGKNVERLHEVIGLLTESPGFYERFSAERNLRYFAGCYHGIDVSGQVEKYLRATGLWERRSDKVASFSKGMKQKLAIARSLLHEPEVIFFDEPTAGLDPEAAQYIRELMVELKDQGRTIFLSTHNLTEAESLCDRIAVIKTRIIAFDTPSNLRKRLFSREVIIEMDSISENIINDIKKLGFINSIKTEDRKLILDMEDVENNRPIVIKSIVESGGMIQKVYEKEHSLEEVYLSLVNT